MSSRPATTYESVNLNVGDVAPDFELPAHDGRVIRLGEFHGRERVILAFYVLAGTPG